MDIGRMSMSMNQGALATAVQLSLIKLQMNTGKEMAVGMKEMMDTMAVDTTKGVNLDKIV
ncbi:MAG: YjfB family protein [Clostridium sp.]|uniref:YjfB family protein n=1 Tax=Clostridium sp. TaxID=1506 RepID=UPI003037A61F